METAYNPFSLEGKKILVTGASSGIGRATALECSRMGADVVITGRNAPRLQETLEAMAPGGHQQMLAELADAEQIKGLVKQMPAVDGVVLCAGKGLLSLVQFSDPAALEDLFRVNVFGPFELARLLYKAKKITRGGSIVALSSIGGSFDFTEGNAVYGMSKAALRSGVKYMAREFSPRGIRANSICPGMIHTPLIHQGTYSDQQLAADAEKYPLKRYGRPEEVAYMCVYLLSDAAAWVTGQQFVIDGGKTL